MLVAAFEQPPKHIRLGKDHTKYESVTCGAMSQTCADSARARQPRTSGLAHPNVVRVRQHLLPIFVLGAALRVIVLHPKAQLPALHRL